MTAVEQADPEAFGDRHLRTDPAGKLRDTPAFPAATVRFVVSDAAASSRAGQLGAWLGVNLLARLDKLVAKIELVCPRRPPDPVLQLLRLPSEEAPGRATLLDLCAELEMLALRVSGGRVRVCTPVECADAPPVELILGGTEASPGRAGHTVWCFGRGWLAFAGSKPELPCPDLRDDPNPLGLYLAVCQGVGEVFKILRGLHAGGLAIEGVYASLWSGCHAERWSELCDGPRINALRLPAAYLVGAGAVGQAVMLATATATSGAEFVTVIDRENFAITNRNRYILAFKDHKEAGKAKHLAAFLQATGTPAHGEQHHWLPYMLRTETHPDNALKAKEAEYRYELVLSCVDENLPRQEIQRVWPRDLLGGSTDGLRAQAAHYDLRTGTACLGCYNPVQSFAQRIVYLRRELEELSPTAKYKTLVALGFAEAEADEVVEYLRRPKCGELAEAALQRFSEQGPPDFAVGFVSVSAGLLVARHWIRLAIEGASGTSPDGMHYLSTNFFNGKFLWTEQLMRSGCFCNEGRSMWNSLWGK